MMWHTFKGEFRLKMRPTPQIAKRSPRAQEAVLDSSFVPSSSWPDSLIDQIATVLAAALVKDIKEHPIGELPASQVAS